jgi:hypothetical protein
MGYVRAVALDGGIPCEPRVLELVAQGGRASRHRSATRPSMDPVAAYETTLATVDAGRAGTVA